MTVSLRKPTDEVWKAIPGHEPYEACDLGMIRNGKTKKILNPTLGGPKRKRYLRVYVGGGRNSSKKPLHVLVLMAFQPRPIDKPLGLHRDDNQFNNHLNNLYWGTPSDNNQDSVRNGSHKKMSGMTNGNSKYSDELIKKIKNEYTGKRGNQTFLAKKYNISISNVHLIVHGKTRVF